MKPEFASLPCGVLILDQKNAITAANPQFCQWLGYTESELIGQPVQMLLPPASKLMYLGHMLPKLQSSGDIEEHYLTFKSATATELPVLLNARKIQHHDGICYLFALLKMQRRNLIEEQFVADRRKAEQSKTELATLSVTDALTGLLNRRYYDQELEKRLSQFQQEGLSFSLLLADIDFFKAINDTHGHGGGDTVLKTVATLLKKNLRDCDVLARIGGEEFAILVRTTDLATALAAADRHRANIAQSTATGIAVTASFGVAMVRPGDTQSSLYERADKALYQAKATGRNRVCAQSDD